MIRGHCSIIAYPLDNYNPSILYKVCMVCFCKVCFLTGLFKLWSLGFPKRSMFIIDSWEIECKENKDGRDTATANVLTDVPTIGVSTEWSTKNCWIERGKPRSHTQSSRQHPLYCYLPWKVVLASCFDFWRQRLERRRIRRRARTRSSWALSTPVVPRREWPRPR